MGEYDRLQKNANVIQWSPPNNPMSIYYPLKEKQKTGRLLESKSADRNMQIGKDIIVQRDHCRCPRSQDQDQFFGIMVAYRAQSALLPEEVLTDLEYERMHLLG